MKNTAILLISCPDRKGLVAGIADFLYRHNANILHADQHQDSELGLFLMRVEWELHDFDLAIGRVRAALRADRREVPDAVAPGAIEPPARGWRFSCRATTTAWPTCSTATRPANCTATSR